jgi:insulysin
MKFRLSSIICLSLIFSSSLQAKGYEDIPDQNELEILTPSLSSLELAKIRLANGLEALLVSDPGATQSAAGLAMKVGSWADPLEYPGMAHFTEHLLFMGSHTYPEENGYFKQVDNHGGALNAFTTSDRTVYMFSVNHDAFPGTLDYFSHMFIDPLFDQSRVSRELHAVDQEHDKNIENDYFREYMVIKDLGNPDHPNAHFATGNKETLGGIPKDAVKKWYETFYSADKAHLVIYSKLPLEELKNLATTHFSAIPVRDSRDSSTRVTLMHPSQKGSLAYIKPVKEIRELSLIWELPESFFTDLEDNSHLVFSSALTSRHAGSLSKRLKEQGLIDDLSASPVALSRESGFFCVNFSLTPEGVSQTEEILSSFFQTLNTLKTEEIPPYLFQEIQNMAKIDYQYQGRIEPFTFASIAYQMAGQEPLTTFPQKTRVPSSYSREKYGDFLALLRPQEAQYTLKAPQEEVKFSPTETEKWTGAQYGVVKIDRTLLQSWSETPPLEVAVYPEQNPFIPSNLELTTTKREEETPPVPTLLLDNPYGKIYYWEDGQYLIPEVSWVFGFKSPLLDQSPKHIALLSLFRKCFDDHMSSTNDYADAANLNSSLGSSHYQMVVSINGLSEKAPVLLDEVLTGLKNCHWTQEEFDLQRSLMVASYENFYKSSPLNQATDTLQNVLFDSSPKVEEQLAALRQLSYEEFIFFKTHLLRQAYAELTLAGNLTKEEAYYVWHNLQSKLHYTPFPKEQHRQRNLLALSSDQGPYKLYEKIESLGNGAVLVLQEGAFSFDKYATAAILSRHLATNFFNTLRTKQQTAYIARSQNMEEEGQLLQLFYVQSTTHQPDDLISRFELFLEGYIKDFEDTISEGEFENIRANIIIAAKQAPNNLQDMSAHLHRLGFKYHGDFHHVQKKIASLASLSYETFKKESLSFLSRENSRRIAIMVEGKPPEGKKFRYQDITTDELKTRGAYVTWEEAH